jgi:hypothetical protein
VSALDQLVKVYKAISPDFEGGVGLQFLREVEYGGNDKEFWIQAI